MGPLFFLCVCVSVHSHALLLIMCVCAWFTLNCSLLLSPPFSKLTALLLRDCSILAAVWHHLLLSLQQLDHVVPVRRRAWSTRQMRWGPARGGRAARWYGDPGPSVSPGCSGDGRPCEWLWLQSRVAWHRGGCASLHGLLHLLAVMNVKLIKAH